MHIFNACVISKFYKKYQIYDEDKENTAAVIQNCLDSSKKLWNHILDKELNRYQTVLLLFGYHHLKESCFSMFKISIQRWRNSKRKVTSENVYG